jgi:hypothetical protein
MTSYAVYDAETGEVVHLHVEPTGLDSSPEEIIQLAGARGSRRLDVVQVPREGAPTGAIRVVEGRLVAAGKDVGTGAAGGSDGLVEPAVPRRYERRPSNDGRGTHAD